MHLGIIVTDGRSSRPTPLVKSGSSRSAAVHPLLGALDGLLNITPFMDHRCGAGCECLGIRTRLRTKPHHSLQLSDDFRLGQRPEAPEIAIAFDRSHFALLSHRRPAITVGLQPNCTSSVSSAKQEDAMRKLLLVLTITSLGMGSAIAQTCESKAVDKNGKALVGAAKNSFVQKCKRDACASKAVDKNGKALSGAAKNSFMQKCENEA